MISIARFFRLRPLSFLFFTFSLRSRLALILAEILGSGADVVCLQECEFGAFDADFAPALGAAGYDGMMQVRRQACNQCEMRAFSPCSLCVQFLSARGTQWLMQPFPPAAALFL